MGGLISFFTLTAIFLMQPFIFMRHELLVFENHAKKHNFDIEFLEKLKTKNLTVECYALFHYLIKNIGVCLKKKKGEIYQIDD